jgi:hypothetical protein
MRAKKVLATTGSGVGRAECREDGQWSVEDLLEGTDVRCIASDPGNPMRVFAGTQGEGVLRSDDSGLTWQASGMDGEIVKSLVVSPHDSNTLFAGVKPAHLYQSQDGGRSWQEMKGFRRIPWRFWWFSPAEAPWQAYVQSISISPTDPEVVLAGIEFGAVVRSQNGGRTWSGHRRGGLRDCHNLKFHHTNGRWAYEAGGTGGGASYSQDGGITWRKFKKGLAKNYGVACAADPAKPEIWYVSVAPSPYKAYGENAEAYLYRASGGADWQPIGWEAHPMKQMPISLVTDPQMEGHLYAGVPGGEVWHSADYGESWERLPFKFKALWSLAILFEG